MKKIYVMPSVDVLTIKVNEEMLAGSMSVYNDDKVTDGSKILSDDTSDLWDDED